MTQNIKTVDKQLNELGRRIICNIVNDAIRKNSPDPVNPAVEFLPVHLRLMSEVSSLTAEHCQDEFV